MKTDPSQNVELRSPNGRIRFSFGIAQSQDAKGCLAYCVDYDDQPILAPSQLALNLADAKPLRDGFEIVRVTQASHDEIWEPVYGERSKIRDCYNEAIVELRESDKPCRHMTLTFRVYDEGAALCYTLGASSEPIHIVSEETEFRFLADHATWATYSAQGKYAKVKLSEVKPGCERPMVIQIQGGPYVALAEAQLVEHARMKLAPKQGVPHCMVSDLSGEVKAEGLLTTPWRVIMIADTPGKLLENNGLLLNLNAPCAIEDTSWIKPGKVIREVTLTTHGGKACIDFAVEHNLQYVEFDAGWYGHEYSDEEDATFVSVDPKRSPGPLDLQAVIDYGEERGVGILLYVNRRALERQLDEILPLYQKWGIKGVKYGFVQVGSQEWTSWMHHAIRKAAEHRLMVDVHDEYRPTGYSRTYPNFVTQEGICGDEEIQPNENTLTTVFTRMIAGAGDNTVCYYNERVDRMSSHAYQLAKAVCIYSPWQFLYWYDRPRASSPGVELGHGIIGDEPELEFFDHIPTVWDDTKVLYGEIGVYAAIARRNGKEWYIGCMNSSETRSLELALTFLDADTQYTASIYSDDPSVATRTQVRIEQMTVDSQTVLRVLLRSNGGQAIRLVQVSDGWRHHRVTGADKRGSVTGKRQPEFIQFYTKPVSI